MIRSVPAPERADKWISRTATGSVAGLAGIAGAISYSHMRQLAAAHGDTGWHAHAIPLSVDGAEIVASLVGPSGCPGPPTIGTAASIAADDGTISRIIAGWPAVALLIAVKLLSGILEHRLHIEDLAGDQASPRADAVPAEITALEQAARRVRDELHWDGCRLTRDALAIGLRAAGYPVGNARLTTLLAALRAEPASTN